MFVKRITKLFSKELTDVLCGHIHKRCLNGEVFVQKMSCDPRNETTVADVVKILDKFAAPTLAETWDNVGLLVEPPSPQKVTRVLLTNDLTEDVLAEALDCGAQLIVSYHPPIFAPLKSITSKSWKERIVAHLLQNSIALYSPHTAWDTVHGGVNDWLASAFGKYDATVKPINQHFIEAPLSYTVCGTFSGYEAAQKCLQDIESHVELPSCKIIQDSNKSLYSVEVSCLKSNMVQVTELMSTAGNVNIIRNEKIPLPLYGAGRLILFSSPISLQAAIDAVKNHLNLKDVSVAIARGKDLQSSAISIALCAGSGASVLKGLKADIYLTGEMLHHDVLDAVHRGTHVILTRHSNSERGFLHVAAELLKKALPVVDISISRQDRDPLETM